VNTLALVTVTNGGKHVPNFLRKLDEYAFMLGALFVVAADGQGGRQACIDAELSYWMEIESRGYIESVLDEVVENTIANYILRIDDDELPSPAMMQWLMSGAWIEAEHWAFPRANLWQDEKHFITNDPLWPDIQTRLSIKSKAGHRSQIHVGSPFGTGKVAPVCIEHYKFLIKSHAERKQIAERYETIRAGAGMSPTYKPFNLPEEHYSELLVADYDDIAAAS
jgi:hypothetical protein